MGRSSEFSRMTAWDQQRRFRLCEEYPLYPRKRRKSGHSLTYCKHAERRSCRLNRLHEKSVVWRCARIEHHIDLLHGRNEILEQLQPVPMSASKLENPVRFPPGRETLVTKPWETGSDTAVDMMGIVSAKVLKRASRAP